LLLPAFLGADSTERDDPLGDVSRLLELDRKDLERIAAVHAALTAPVRAFVGGLARGMRAPSLSSVRPRVATQAVQGSIDWGATVRHRTRAGSRPGECIVRPAKRVFDTPESRGLAYLLKTLEERLRSTRLATSAKGSNDWQGELHEARQRVRLARATHWLADVPPERPGPEAHARMRATRSLFYATLIPDALKVLDRYDSHIEAHDVVTLLIDRYFEPKRDAQLFELAVALRVAQALAAHAGKRKARMPIGTEAAPYATYEMHDGAEVQLWAQRWPPDTGDSVLAAASRRHGIAAQQPRPDLVAQRRHDDEGNDTVLIEIKASRKAKTLRRGLVQLLTSLRDRPLLDGTPPTGWLVAPASDAFTRADPVASDLWVVGADEVAEALARRFGCPPA